MKTLALLLLSCTTLLAGPAIPALRSIVTTTNGCVLRWNCHPANVEAFQIMRSEHVSTLPPLPDAIVAARQNTRWFTLNPNSLKQLIISANFVWEWTDTNTVSGVTYGYSVISLGIDGQSRPSNELTVKR